MAGMRHAGVPGGLFQPLARALARLVAVLEGVAFWAAATFPFVHLAAVAMYAQDALSGTVLVGLAAMNAVAIVLGHRHNRLGGDRA